MPGSGVDFIQVTGCPHTGGNSLRGRHGLLFPSLPVGCMIHEITAESTWVIYRVDNVLYLRCIWNLRIRARSATLPR